MFLRCFACGEPGHRQTACPNQTRRGLFVDDNGKRVAENDDYDSADGDGEEPVLVSRFIGLTPQQREDHWLRSNIFCFTCTIRDRVYTFVIDSGSCKNVIAEEAVRKLGLSFEKHPTLYSMTWLQDGVSFRVSHRFLVPFSIGEFYKDMTYFDVAPMNVSHLSLGRPWEYDRKIIHDGAANTYEFLWETHKIILLPTPDIPLGPQSPSSPTCKPTLPPVLNRQVTFKHPCCVLFLLSRRYSNRRGLRLL